jgi:hypothetical protein
LIRRKHKLKTNKSTEAPYRFLFTDTETVGKRLEDGSDEQILRLGAACYWERPHSSNRERIEWHSYRSVDEFWEIVDSYSADRTRLVLFAHNVGFDLQVLGGPTTLRAHGWIIRKAIIDSPRFIFKARRGSQSLWILDWFNYFRGSLAFAGELVGVPKLPMPTDTSDDQAWAVYCRNDVLVLFSAVRRYVEFLSRYDLGAFAYTLAGQSLNAYRHRFMEASIFIHTDRKAIAIERQAYFGGRTEIFRQGRLPTDLYAYVDINSAYASVMHDNEFPTALVGVVPTCSVERLELLCQKYAVIAEVGLEVTSPLFPLRAEQRLCFPVGTYRTTLPTPELEIALTRGLVKSVGALTIYRKAAIFRNWVEEIYELRKDAKAQGDALWDELLKRLMNSLFGKFGQLNDEWEFVEDEPGEPDRIWTEYNLDMETRETFRRLGGVKERSIGNREGYNSFVAIAAQVTSYGRALLLKYIEQAGFSNVFYCDTDSLIVNKQGLENLKDSLSPSKLGALKLEGQASDVILNAPKNYVFGELSRHKGRRKDAVELPDRRYRQTQFVSLQGALRAGHTGGPLIRQIEKRDAFAYRKGTVLDSGVVIPLRFDSPSGV